MELCIVAIFKNEGHALKEWLDHYLREGVDHFFLVDNGSDDGYDIQEYIKKGIVDVWINPKKNSQIESNNHYLQKAKQYKWVMVVDLDEFMYARNGFKTIKEYLRSVKPDIDQIRVLMKYFGSSGHIKQPKSIIQGFTRRKLYSNMKKSFTDVKCIVRGKSLIRLDIHVHQINHSKDMIPSKKVSHSKIIESADENTLDTCYLHINHYKVQSWEFYKNIKMTRGDSAYKTGDKMRNRKSFKKGDTNDKLDTELKRKTKKHL